MKTPLLLTILAASAAMAAQPLRADDPAVPSAGFTPSRYETLWTKSPFAVATAEVVQDSPDYSLVGIAEFDGISYASLIEKQNQEHFLISTDKPVRGLTLTSITHGHDGADTFAVIQKDGQAITLKLETAPINAVQAGPGAMIGNNTINMPGNVPPAMPMPGTGMPTFPGMGSARPFTRIHRPLIHLPPQPLAAQQIQSAPPPQAASQAQPTQQIQPPPPPH